MVTGQPDFFRSTVIQAQTAGIYLIRDWSAKQAFFKDWWVSGTVDSDAFESTDIYTVPTEHILYVNDVQATAFKTRDTVTPALDYLTAGTVFARLWNTGIGKYICTQFLNTYVPGDTVSFSRPPRLDAGATLRSIINNYTTFRIGFLHVIYSYEESPSTERKTYDLNEDEIFKRGLWNSCGIELKPKEAVVTLYNTLTGKLFTFKGRKVGTKIRLSKTKRHKVEWWKGY